MRIQKGVWRNSMIALTLLAQVDAQSSPQSTIPTPDTIAVSPPAPSGSSIRNFWGIFRKFRIGSPKPPPVSINAQDGGQGPRVIEIESRELPRGIQGLEYDADIRITLDGRCPQAGTSLFLAGGALPRGLRTTAAGLAGVPAEVGVFRFWVGVRNTCASAKRKFELTITGRPILRAVPDRIEITVSPDSASVDKTVVISSTWPDLAYTIFPRDPSWLKLRQVRGITAETGDRAIVTAIPRQLAPGIHHGALIISAWRADPITIDVTVTVTMPKSPSEPGPWNAGAAHPAFSMTTRQ